MKFGLIFANTGPFADPKAAVTFARAAEAAGFESLWTVEHVVVPSGYQSAYPYDPSGKMPGGEEFPIPDPLIWLSYLASATETIRLATGILILPQRNPVVLAKECATLDHLSGGRLELGIGVGWLQEEFDALGVPWERRGARTDEHIEAMRALWTDQKASYHGEFVDFADCVSLPKPAQGTIPVHIGGHSDAAAKRAGRLGDGFFPGRGDHAELARLIELTRRTAEEHGRDPGAVEFTAGGNGVIGSNAVDEAKALADIGVTRAIIPSFLFWSDPETSLRQFGEDIIAKV